MVGLTGTGRRLAASTVRRAYQATGWRTPRAGARHHGRRLRAATNRRLRSGSRATARAAGRTARRSKRAAGRLAAVGGRRVRAHALRWNNRHTRGAPASLWRTRSPGATDNGEYPPQPKGPAEANDKVCPECCEPAVHRPPTDLTPYQAHGTSRPAWSHADGSPLCPVAGTDGYQPAEAINPDTADVGDEPPGPPSPGGPDPPDPQHSPLQPDSSTSTTAPTGAERSTTSMTSRYAINLERPSTDAEFLESCIQLGDALKSLAEQVADWADSLSALNLPPSVLNPLHAVSDGIEDAAAGATKAATAFEDEFEDARDVASRGMTITGQDAA